MTVNEWAKDFKGFVNELQMPRDDYNGIMEFIDDALALLKEQEAEVNDRQKKVEFIESYIKIGNGNYEWSDNHGELIRCKDCVHWDKGHSEECENTDSICFHNGWCEPDWFCADGKRKEDL